MSLFKPSLDILQPRWSECAPASVDALFTARAGGVSSGPWGDATGIMGLNVAFHTGDAPACVKMNRGIVAQLVPSDPKWLTQTHSTKIVCADDVNGALGDAPQADASYSMTPGTVCTVMVADCLPVLISDTQGRIVAAVHAGWKGLADGIIQKTIETLRCKLNDEQASFAVWLAPRIGKESFEVGEDVLVAMKKHLPDAQDAFVGLTGGKYLCDLALLARQALALSNVPPSNVFDCALSTVTNKERFFSYRRDGECSGRHAAMIWIKATA